MTLAETPEPPYTAVIFSSARTEGDHGYALMSERMFALAAEQPGYLGVEAAREDGLGLTVSYWVDEDAAAAWKQVAEHLVAQERGAIRLVRRLPRAGRDRHPRLRPGLTGVREPPAGVAGADVLAAVRTNWDPDLDTVEHLPVGFGAHHWVALASGRRRLFVTLDGLLPRHTPESLEGAYAGAAALADQGLEFVVASLPSRGHYTQPFGDGALSATPGSRAGSPARVR